MTAWALVALGGALGASTRFAIVSWWRSRFPWAILAVNIAGSFVVGVLLPRAHDEVLLFVGVGFCGALTTFSTFALDTLVLAREGRFAASSVNIALSIAASIAACAAGLVVGGSLGS